MSMRITKAEVQSALARVLAALPDNPYIDPRFFAVLDSKPSRPCMSTCLTGAVLAQLPVNFNIHNPRGGTPGSCLAELGYETDDDAADYLRLLMDHNDARGNWHDAPRD